MAAMAQPAPLDALAHLACPPAPKANRGAAALHAGQLLAYAAGAAVVVVDVSGVECMVATGWVRLCRLAEPYWGPAPCRQVPCAPGGRTSSRLHAAGHVSHPVPCPALMPPRCCVGSKHVGGDDAVSGAPPGRGDGAGLVRGVRSSDHGAAGHGGRLAPLCIRN